MFEYGRRRLEKRLAKVHTADLGRAGQRARQRMRIRRSGALHQRLDRRNPTVGRQLQRALEAECERIFLEADDERLVIEKRLTQVFPETLLKLRVALAIG